MSRRIISAFAQYFDGNGSPLAGGKLYFYENKSSSVEQDTFRDPELTIVNTNPLILDGEGRAADAYGDGVYRVVLTDANGVQIEVNDNVNSSTLEVNSPPGSVNNIVITNSTSGEDPVISSEGQDANVSMRIATQALGSIKMETNSVQRMKVDESGITLGSGGVSADVILDEDDMVSNNDSALATQQSIKAYVDDIRPGKVLQIVELRSSTGTSTNAWVPLDSTIPQSNEGALIDQISITPLSDTSTFIIEFSCFFSADVWTTYALSVFETAESTDSIFSQAGVIGATSWCLPHYISFQIPSTGTTSRTFDVRTGPQATDKILYINSIPPTPLYGSTDKQLFRITEIQL